MFIHDTWRLIWIPDKYCNTILCGIESIFSITNQRIKWKWSHIWRRWLDLQGTYLSLFVNTNWNLYVIHSKYIFYVLIGTMYIIMGWIHIGESMIVWLRISLRNLKLLCDMEWFRLGLSNILALRYVYLEWTLRIKPTLCSALTHLRTLIHSVGYHPSWAPLNFLYKS